MISYYPKKPLEKRKEIRKAYVDAIPGLAELLAATKEV